MGGCVENDVFPSVFRAGGEFGDAEQPLRSDAEFFLEFAAGGRFVVFAGVDVACGGGVPDAGMSVLQAGALLQQAVAVFVEDEDVDGAVHEPANVHFPAGGLPEDAILRVDDVEEFVVFLGDLCQRVGVIGARKFDPLRKGKFFRTGRRRDFQPCGYVGPERRGRHLFVELFAAL